MSMRDLRDELRLAASPAAIRAWDEARADYTAALRYWDRPLAHELMRLCVATEEAFASAWIWQALGDGWSVVDLFGYAADDATGHADFGVVTGIGLDMFGEILLVEANLAILKWAHPSVGAELKPEGKVSFRYDRRIMNGKAMVPWWRHSRLDPGPGRCAPPPLADVLGRLAQ
jgi:hypothetical protein